MKLSWTLNGWWLDLYFQWRLSWVKGQTFDWALNLPIGCVIKF